MEMNFDADASLAEEAAEVEYNNDNYAVEGERCGICMDIIIDRGVLDCCNHWFCFACIDDWASITNLCPLCQNVFQSITCVPVYDTIGNNLVDDEFLSGDDDWSIERSSSKLSFPSYYIDENAVTCLDGGGCKIRNGLPSVVNDCDNDTSIACDICNIWYHAYCVDFYPQDSFQDTWVCPRCREPDVPPVSKPFNSCGVDTSSDTFINRTGLSGNVCVSIADAGETAVVVSMMEASESIQHTCEGSHVDNSDKYVVTCTPDNVTSSEIMRRDDQNGYNFPMARCKSAPVKKEFCNKPGSEVGLSFSHCDGDTTRCNVDNVAIEDTGFKRKHEDCRDVSTKNLACVDINYDDEDKFSKNTKELERQASADSFADDDAMKSPFNAMVSKDVKSKKNAINDVMKFDVMSIVRGTGHKTSGKSLNRGKFSDEAQNKAGLRLKKIMRSSDDKQSCVAVQKLREEIRDAVRNRSASNIDEHVFDPKLLSAFRAAITSSSTEPVMKLSSGAIKFKKTLLQKGKVRENLTKKIYGSSNGKRKRAWNRECEVEFWKHRCIRATKPEKVATLNSVLNLLKHDKLGSEEDKESEGQKNNSILSRLYLADTSVFPRKDNIIPLSAIAATSNSDNNHSNSSCVSPHKASSNGQQKNSSRVVRPGNEKEKRLGNGKSIGKPSLQSDLKVSKQSSIGRSNLTEKETAVESGDRMKDKRKWALDVLARKKAVESRSDEVENQEEDDALRANFSLLVKLPRDMRPQVAPTRHNKIPVSVRQKQLYRLAEHFLKKLNLAAIRRSAETELAVADAINIEKRIAERSNSKQGYLNLCSHEIMQRSNGIPALTPQASNSENVPLNEQSCEETSGDPDVLDALRNAGLVSNSPPESPKENKSILDMESPFESTVDVDIYGDFEYDLDGQDYIGSADVKCSKQREDIGNSKMKIVLATPHGSIVNALEDPVTSHKLENVEKSKIPSSTDYWCIRRDEKDEELSVVECEALYGPEKEPISERAFDSEVEPAKRNLVSEKEVANGGSDKNCKQNDRSGVTRKVEAYVKEHIRPLCKSGVISGEQYRWAVTKTTEKVMRYHSDSKNANFLIKEGHKVKKLAEQYVEAAQHKPQT